MIRHKALHNGFQYIEITNACAEAKIALQGAHVFHYKTKDNDPLLWLSEEAFFEEGKAIRGGIPLCFPWFGKHKTDTILPQHGFARTSLWSLSKTEEIDKDTTEVQLQLLPTPETKALWPYDFDVRLDVLVGSELTMTLSITNTDTKPFEISLALHTYFNISDVDNVVVEGLKGCAYFDSLEDKTYIQKEDLTIEEEVDRIYSKSAKDVILQDTHRNIVLRSEGSNSLVVWNPWVEKAKQMADMHDEGYRNMLCLETGNIREDARTVEVGETHVLKAVMKSS
ncbi:MAG: D-hexose-6-phosphate mutarotase [Sulfurovum sp.]|nr:D-hexose-6-phosphate mutarotase [Sulfurovum sp.]